MEPGYFEGDTCKRGGCAGTIECHEVKGCSCHINPPCSACTAPRNYCRACGWEEADEPVEYTMNGYDIKEDRKTGAFISWKPRELDPTKIDYRVSHHTYSSQLVEGVYPEGTTRAEIEARVKGTFGGRFERFGGGKFKYVAYTD